MAEEIKIEEDGSIKQVEMTSCGLNGGPLEGIGTYPASICCCLMPKEGNIFYPFFKGPITAKTKTYITQSGKDDDKVETQFIKNIKDGCLIGYKYFDLSGTKAAVLSLKGKGSGKIAVRYAEDGEDVDIVEFQNKGGEFNVELPINRNSCKSSLYFYFKEAKGKFDFFNFELK